MNGDYEVILCDRIQLGLKIISNCGRKAGLSNHSRKTIIVKSIKEHRMTLLNQREHEAKQESYERKARSCV